MNHLLKPITPPGINPYKLVELYAKYWEDELYLKPDNKVLKSLRRRRSSGRCGACKPMWGKK